MDQGPLTAGSRVVVHGLLSEVGRTLNGSRGTVQEAGERVVVVLDGMKAPKSFRPKNVHLLEQEGDESDEGVVSSKAAFVCGQPGCLHHHDHSEPSGGQSVLPVKLLKCAGCRNIHYCSKACQQQHWPMHKENCRRNRQVRQYVKQKTKSMGAKGLESNSKQWILQSSALLTVLASYAFPLAGVKTKRSRREHILLCTVVATSEDNTSLDLSSYDVTAIEELSPDLQVQFTSVRQQHRLPHDAELCLFMFMFKAFGVGEGEVAVTRIRPMSVASSYMEDAARKPLTEMRQQAMNAEKALRIGLFGAGRTRSQVKAGLLQKGGHGHAPVDTSRIKPLREALNRCFHQEVLPLEEFHLAWQHYLRVWNSSLTMLNTHVVVFHLDFDLEKGGRIKHITRVDCLQRKELIKAGRGATFQKTQKIKQEEEKRKSLFIPIVTTVQDSDISMMFPCFLSRADLASPPPVCRHKRAWNERKYEKEAAKSLRKLNAVLSKSSSGQTGR